MFGLTAWWCFVGCLVLRLLFGYCLMFAVCRYVGVGCMVAELCVLRSYYELWVADCICLFVVVMV